MAERSGLSDNGRFLAAVIHYCELEVVRFDAFGLSNLLRHLPFCDQLRPFVQLTPYYALTTGMPEKWYSYALKSAIDELVERHLVQRVDHNWLAVRRDILRDFVRELARAAPEIMDHSLALAKTADVIKTANARIQIAK